MPDDGFAAARPPRSHRADDASHVLSARLLAARRATRALQAWCEERGIGDGPVLARRGTAPPARPSRGRDDDVLDALRPGPNEAVARREVVLVRGAVARSIAENRHLPERLTPARRALLETTDAPFGLVIEPLRPRRRTTLVAFARDGAGFERRAVVVAADGRPLAAVRERYQPALAAAQAR